MFQKTVSSLNDVVIYGKTGLLTLNCLSLPADPSRNKAEKVHFLMSLTIALVVGVGGCGCVRDMRREGWQSQMEMVII